MIQKQAILELVLAAVQSLNEELEPSRQLQLAEDTLLFGEGSDLDSLSLVSVIVDIETAVADQFGEPISLTDDKAMSRPVSPYTHVGALVDYIFELLGGTPT
jgi:acyl carrier protein